MPQWWRLKLLQYVAASFHLPSVSTDNINTVQYQKCTRNVKCQKPQLLWYPRCFFLSPTTWQLCTQRQQSMLWCLSRTVNKYNATYFIVHSVRSFRAHLNRYLPNVSKYQSTILKFIFLVLTDLILCSLQIFEKKAYNEALHQLLIEFKKPCQSVRREVWYNTVVCSVFPWKY